MDRQSEIMRVSKLISNFLEANQTFSVKNVLNSKFTCEYFNQQGSEEIAFLKKHKPFRYTYIEKPFDVAKIQASNNKWPFHKSPINYSDLVTSALQTFLENERKLCNYLSGRKTI